MKSSGSRFAPVWAVFVSCAGLAACGGGGGGGSSSGGPPPPPPPPADTTAPDTTIGSGPAAFTTATSATFLFTSNEAGTFEGRLDGAAFAAVTSPHVLNNLAEGNHTFEVRARDAAANTDATPASFTWAVDNTPPDTQITAAPSSTGIVSNSPFTVNSTETSGTLEASLDGAPFVTVTSPYTPPNLTDGAHTIEFRARDAAGNTDASPASASWTVDATPAQVRLIFPTRNSYTDAATVSVRGTAQDANGVAGISINGVAAQTTDNFAHWNAVIPVPVATTTVSITSTDGPGNVATVGAATIFNRGPFLNMPRGVAYDPLRNRVIVIDQATGDLVAFNRSTGIGQIISAGPAPGTTPGSTFEEVVVDAANDRALILNASAGTLIGVNLATGARSEVSADTGSSSPTRMHGAFCLTLDPVNQRVYASVGLTASIVRVNLSNGTRSVVSSNTQGTGDPLVNPYGIVYDAVSNPATPRLLVIVSPFTGSGMYSIDLATGNRTPFSTATVGTGTPLGAPLSMVMDAAGSRVLVNDINNGSTIAVALATGNRTTISSYAVGSGPFMSFGVGSAFDPVSRTLFGASNGGFGEIDTVSLQRRTGAHTDVGTGDRIQNVVSIAIEPGGSTPESLLYLTPQPGTIHRLNLATSNRQIVSWSGVVGAGPSMNYAMDMVFDRRPVANGRAALVLVGGTTPKLLSVDLVTGDRTLIADINAGTTDNAPQRMALDVANNRVIFVNYEWSGADVDEVYAVNLANGNLTMISGPASSGPQFAMPSHIVLEPAANPTRALIGDFSTAQILAVDLATGTRSLFDNGNYAGDLVYTRTGPMIVDAARGRLLVNHVDYPSNIFARPLAGGLREIVTGANPLGLVVRGSGPPLFWVQGMDADFTNDIAYVASTNNGSIIAVDLVSGDRVILAH